MTFQQLLWSPQFLLLNQMALSMWPIASPTPWQRIMKSFFPLPSGRMKDSRHCGQSEAEVLTGTSLSPRHPALVTWPLLHIIFSIPSYFPVRFYFPDLPDFQIELIAKHKALSLLSLTLFICPSRSKQGCTDTCCMLGSTTDVREQSLATFSFKQSTSSNLPVQCKLLRTARNLHSGLVWMVSCSISPLPGPCVLWKSFLLFNYTLLYGT